MFLVTVYYGDLVWTDTHQRDTSDGGGASVRVWAPSLASVRTTTHLALERSTWDSVDQ